MYNARMIANLQMRLEALVWGDMLSKYGFPGRLLATVMRYLFAVLRDVMSGQLTLRAMSLVYTTLLSIVPLLAFSFSVLKGLGVHNDLKHRLSVVLEPLGDKGTQITDQVMRLVENVNGSVLGGIGLTFFLYTAISMVQKIEESFNYVWYVSESRSFARRFTEYSLVLLIGPVLIVIALGLLTTLQNDNIMQYLINNNFVGPVLDVFGKLVPYLIVIAVFTFLYMFVPNTNVQFRSALVGGVAGGVMWAVASSAFAAFVSDSTGKQVVYASFAIAIFALIWLYLNWLILLIGAQLAFYFQNPAYLRLGRREPRLSCSMRERLVLNIMFLVGREFREPGEGMTVPRLASALRIPSLTLAPTLASLQASGLLTVSEQEQILPGREMNRISLNDILAVVRVQGETGSHQVPRWTAEVNSIGAEVDAAVARTLGDASLSDLLDGELQGHPQ
ncbi:MAG TPA: YihY/virulence factor BrkB family protein [Woeseiaceae bacterium]|nr:YihY/virulence factor BrkB family protein [Woeseiaceae bacterium]